MNPVQNLLELNFTFVIIGRRTFTAIAPSLMKDAYVAVARYWFVVLRDGH